MKYIRKGEEPSYLKEYRAKVRDAKMSPKQGYEASDMPKAQLLEDLIQEQGAICCYCMGRIRKDSQRPPHIEHYRPQSLDPKLALDYKNLLAVCFGQAIDNKGKRQWYCDHENAKSNRPLQFLDPLDPSCEKVLQYTAEGSMRSSREDVQQDIDLLNLNCNFLRNARQQAIKPVLQEINKKFPNKTVSRSFLEERIKKWYSRGENDHFRPYCQAVIFTLQKLLAKAR